MVTDLNGEWTFNEDFGFGKDEGFAHFKQKGSALEGYLEFTESIENEAPFRVREHVKGQVINGQIGFYGISFEIIESEKPIEYRLDQWEAIINVQGQIVGHSIDDDGTSGVFIMTRIEL